MAFPATTLTSQQAWDRIRRQALDIRDIVQALRNDSAAGNTERRRYVFTQRRLQIAIDEWDALSTTPGLQAYARDQLDDQTLNLATEFTQMRAAAIALRDWIFANVPTHAGTGAQLLTAYSVDGLGTELTFNTGQTGQFRTEADTFLATII